MASISTLRKPDGTIKGFQTNLGKDPTTGKAQRKFHKTYDEAQAYIKSEESGKLGTGELYRKRAEIIFCLQRLTKAGATINEATEFFLRHGAKMGNPAFEDVVSNFIKDKRQAERRKNYLDDLAVKFEVFGRYIGPETKIGDITEEQIKEYIFVKNESNSKVTKLNNIRCLSVIFNYAIKKKFISLNPVAGIERPTVDFVSTYRHCTLGFRNSPVLLFAEELGT